MKFLAKNDAISIFSWSPNKFYHILLGSQIKAVVESCHKSERQGKNQKDKEPIVYKTKSVRIKYILVDWVGEHLVKKGGIFKSTLWHTILYNTKLKLKKCFNLVYGWKYSVHEICTLRVTFVSFHGDLESK